MQREFQLANPADTPLIFDMYMEKAKWFQEKGIDQWDQEYLKIVINSDIISNYIHAKEYFVLKDDGNIVAGCILMDEASKWEILEEDCKYLDYFVSLKAGAGRFLLEKIIEFCRENGIKKLKLDCQDHNEELKNYYFKLGFKQVGRIKHKHFPDRYSCLMCLEL